MILTLLIIIIVLLVLFHRPLWRAWKMLVLMMNIVPNSLSDFINFFTPKVSREESHYMTADGLELPMLIYHPRSTKRTSAIVLYHGATPAGEGHEVMNRVARAMAKIGLRVFVPRLPRLKEALIREETAERIIEVFEQVRDRQDVVKQKVMLVGLSFAGGILVKACSNDRIKGQPAVVLSYGSYFDLNRTLRFVFTGNCSHGGKQYHFEPHDWGRIVFFHNYLKEIEGDFSPENVRPYFLKTVQGDEGGAQSIYGKLGEEDRRFVDMVMGGDGNERMRVAESIMSKIQPTITLLSPKSFLDKIDFHLFLMHGANDTMVPFTETLDFYESLAKEGKSADYFISHLYAHSDVGGHRNMLPGALWELWRMGKFLDSVFKVAF